MVETAEILQIFPVSEFTCTKCKKQKPISEFQKDSHKKHGHSYFCKSCYRPLKKQSGIKWRSNKENREKNKERQIWYDKKRYFGITKDQYMELLIKQDSACAICRKKPDPNGSKKNRNLWVDHNHNTKEIRGLLCQRCNHGIGLLGDSITIIKNAAKYLEERGNYGEA